MSLTEPTGNTCRECREKKPLAEFPIRGRPPVNRKPKYWAYGDVCKVCRADRSDEHHEPAPKMQNRRSHLRRQFGLTQADYIALSASQGHGCAICRTAQETLCVDHCHETSRIRGLLCHKCNTALGLFNDDVELLINASKYVQKLVDT